MDELEQLAEWYPLLGDWLKAHFAGWHANLFSGDLRLAKLIHLSPKRRTPLYNGSLQCRLFVINMVEGSARKENRASRLKSSSRTITPRNNSARGQQNGEPWLAVFLGTSSKLEAQCNQLLFSHLIAAP